MPHDGPGRRCVTLGTMAVLLLAGCGGSTEPDPPPPPAGAAVVIAAGDLVCGAATPANRPCEHAATAAAAEEEDPDAVLLLGDLQYENATLAEFRQYYSPTWGLFDPVAHPVPGNHEYQTAGAAGYFDYFNGPGAGSGPAGDRSRGYYSVTIGAWRVLALNSNCAAIGGCAAGSAQERWVRSELARQPTTCTLAFWHHPPFTSSARAASSVMLPIWRTLHELGVDVVLTAHEHQYERFAPMDGQGAVDSETGTRLFVVGTGGRDLHAFGGTPHPASQARNQTTFGVLKLVLREASYDWEFVAAAGGTYTDSGSHDCT